MVDTPTIRNPDYKDLNLALNVVAKCGVTPWVLPDSISDADFFVGLSYTRSARNEGARIMGFANVFNEYGRWEFYSGGGDTFPYEERTTHYEALVSRTLERLSLSERPSICFHYSARFSREDRDAILRGARSIRPDGVYFFVWINSHHNVRFYDSRPDTDGSLARGKICHRRPESDLCLDDRPEPVSQGARNPKGTGGQCPSRGTGGREAVRAGPACDGGPDPEPNQAQLGVDGTLCARSPLPRSTRAT